MRLKINNLESKYYCYEEKLPKNFEYRWGIYIFVKKNDILYIGMSQNLRSRVNKYFALRAKGQRDFDYVAIIPIDRSFLFSMERATIQEFNPRHNKKPGKHVNFWAP